MATVSGQLGGLAADVEKESKAVREGTSGRIAVVRERLDVIDGKVGELERKHSELQELSTSIQTSAVAMKEGAPAQVNVTEPAPTSGEAQR